MARIAVIGAGTGAMAAAARLAVAGHRVTVYERSQTYGGSVGRYTHEGFVFDTGPALLHLPAVYRDLFVKTGREPLEQRVTLTQVDPSGRHIFADGTAVSLPNASRAGVVAALDGALGAGAGARWGDFLDRAGTAWDRSRRPLLEEPLPAGPLIPGRDPYPRCADAGCCGPQQAGTPAEIGAWELADPGWRPCWTDTRCRTGWIRAMRRPRPPCCRTWRRHSAAGTRPAGFGRSRRRCTSVVWPVG
ncbi:NAD(P)-binding protein [Streptomyces sp. M10(2022)]